ncbi:MAG: NAD-dependent epimerase/dehydratase family protein [Opitutales bacterium]|nr:NAD-dependent epimerase/dehydratase family protein [Opitutales bacterium]
MKTPLQSLLILGCGYLGIRLARQAISNGWHVGALTHNPRTGEQLVSTGLQTTIVAELNTDSWHASLSPADWSVVVNCVGSGSGTIEGYRSSYVDGMRSIMEWKTRDSSASKFIYTSSASVYGDFKGAWIDEAVSTLPASPQGDIILESERMITASSNPFQNWFILRLGGLYGPERDAFLRNRIPDPNARSDPHLNLIHVDDAVAAILRLAEHQTIIQSGIYNLTDNHPTPRSLIDQWALSRIREDYPVQPNELRANQSKRRSSQRPDRRISSSAFMKATGWEPLRLPPFATASRD